MRKSIRFFGVLAFLTMEANLHSFGSSVLCRSLPVAVTVARRLRFCLSAPSLQMPCPQGSPFGSLLTSTRLTGTHGIDS